MSSPSSGSAPTVAPLFAGLPAAAPVRWRYFGYSFILQSILLLGLVHYGVIQPDTLVPRQLRFITLAVPPAPINHAPQRIPPRLLVRAPRIKMEPPPQVAKLEAPPPPAIPDVPQPKPVLPEVKALPAPPQVKTGNFDTAAASEKRAPRPVPQIETGAFSTGSSATPTALLAANKVQTGGFGDPNGVPASPNGKNGPNTIARLGSFDLPSGPGYGNGTGGASGRRAVVASAGFGNGIAVGGGGNGHGGTGRTVRDSGFGDAAPVRRVAATEIRQPQAAALSPVQIEFKPKPTYTPEARQLHLEGEVLVEVVFTADGRVHVKGVVRGLGHGLDEQAVKAAEQIRFKPATRGGSPVDAPALLHIVFQLA